MSEHLRGIAYDSRVQTMYDPLAKDTLALEAKLLEIKGDISRLKAIGYTGLPNTYLLQMGPQQVFVQPELQDYVIAGRAKNKDDVTAKMRRIPKK